MGFFVSNVRPRYHARTDSRRVARGCTRGLSDDAWTQFCFSAGSTGGREKLRWQKGPPKIRPGFAGPSRDDVDKASALSGSVTCSSDRTPNHPSRADAPGTTPLTLLFILNSGVNTVAYSNAGATLCPAIRR